VFAGFTGLCFPGRHACNRGMQILGETKQKYSVQL
jgi:hypothetical protein